jgi:acetolactate synthase-1/2/3 large subunit
MARAQGLDGWGPITDRDGLRAALGRAVETVLAGRPAVVDVVVDTEYDGEMAAAMIPTVE